MSTDNDEIFEAADNAGRMIALLAGLRKQAIDAGFTEPAAEWIVMSMFGASLQTQTRTRRGRRS